ncbi:Histidinol-phosphate aminotransferase 2 [Kingella potus]|uniref:Histidinol-phosphate aminotransferase n=1 Tax=Kingella potus TaxID=265175 RepID=A0A377R505_9NEIS|nr:histidinol-phosphate transaminase [Kingella potus]UOP00053.1 histidinol-phosphate transaminase [Kingella potus]STR03339.1 Histidinol-phosphate aminotransferase 2 [Kingella potus]
MNTIQNLVRENIRKMSAYAVADVPASFIKLDAMELPCRFPESLRRELAAELAEAEINRYPNAAACGLQPLLRDVFGIPAAARIVLGNGSDELIQLLTLLLAKPGAKMLALDPGFVMYRHNAALFGMEYVGVPLNADFTLNLPAVLAALAEHRPALVFLAYPNNPTGVGFAREDVQAVIDAAPGVVVVDEAYGAFSGGSFLPQAGGMEKLVLLRTLSKTGFAGLRLGYACCHPVLADELEKIVPPYNMNRLSLAAAAFALRHYGWVAEQIDMLKQERARLASALAALPGVCVFPSEANFLTVRVADAAFVFDKLKENGILIKKLHGTHPLLEGCLRFTVGSPEENRRVCAVLQTVCR